MRLVVRPRAMLDAARHDVHLSGSELDIVSVAKLDYEPAGEDQEEVIRVLVLVPDELAARLDHRELVVVQLPTISG